MGNLFAKKSKATRITEQDKAVLVCLMTFWNSHFVAKCVIFMFYVYSN